MSLFLIKRRVAVVKLGRVAELLGSGCKSHYGCVCLNTFACLIPTILVMSTSIF